MEEALTCLPEDERETIKNLDVQSDDLTKVLSFPHESLSRIHYTWFVPLFEQMEPGMKPFLFSSLPEGYPEKLQGLLKEKIKRYDLARPFKEYFQLQLYRLIGAKEIVPLSFLPQSSIKTIAHLKKDVLVDLIDLIGTYDLAVEAKQVVDKKQLTKIYTALSKKQRKFFQSVINQREIWHPIPLGLDRWAGDGKKLRKVLHQRGIKRLGISLKGQSEDMRWHICRKLDTGRAKSVQKQFSEELSEDVVKGIEKQLLYALNFIKRSDNE